MNKILLTAGTLAVMGMPAMAETKWFIGAGLGYAEPVLSDLLDSQIDNDMWNDDSGNLVPYITGGIRFGDYQKIYNGGASATFEYMSELGSLSDGPANPYFMDASMDLKTLYVSYDNYIRLSGDFKYRTDFIASIGIGFAWIDEDITLPGYGTVSYSDTCAMGVLKFGFGGETIVPGLGWNAMASFAGLNAKDTADMQGYYKFDIGVKYTF